MQTLSELMNTLPQAGRVEWIGIRPARRADVEVLSMATASANGGLDGDHYAKPGGKRQVTLIQSEHIDAVASMLGVPRIDPAPLRRNIVVSGINLLALKDKSFRIGEATLRFTGLCHPCSLMESTLGPGGYNALRGHGGITASVVGDGRIALGDSVIAQLPASDRP
jgi:MOSC domain-containing protein YiiM